MKIRLAAVLLLAGTSLVAHRLDEYLQGAIISIEKNRVEVEISLTPGVAVFPVVLADIDTNADGVVSIAEQHAYAGRVLHDLSLSIDGHALAPRLLSVKFPGIEELQGGSGQIRIAFDAALPGGGLERKLIFENHHMSRIAAYQVNCLIPHDRDLRIVAQSRNYTQSFYQLEYTQPGIRADLSGLAWLPSGAPGVRVLLGAVLLIFVMWRLTRFFRN